MLDTISKTVTVELTWPEVNAACQVALFRQVHNKMRGLKDRYGASPDFFEGMSIQTRGCLGELAVSKYLNRYWSGVQGMREPDVAFWIDARTREDIPNRKLILHESDNDAMPFVVAKIGQDARFVELTGWIVAKDGKRREFWSDPSRKNRWAFFVPDDALNAMEELKSVMLREGR